MAKYILDVKDADGNTMDILLTALEDKIAMVTEITNDVSSDYEKDQLKNAVMLQLEDDIEGSNNESFLELLDDLLEDDYSSDCLQNYIRTNFEV